MTLQSFEQTKTLPFSAAEMYAVAADILAYPEFLPWCLAARITKTSGADIYADLIIGFQLYKEKFTSKVTLTPNTQIDVTYIKGPFKTMDNQWRFKALSDTTCEVHFEMQFEFNSFIFKKLSGLFFEEAATKMIDSFEKRAYSLYK